ncbi:SHOCT domain-containing protein [Erythrobacter dokdonensis]|uniref:Trypsin-like serine protease n=1 Tax=Erythrobacter dokdonensis DSW-74 TaxID=1300349 RepID=A0A1A7BM83_9SPHN|nr:SHOCT domain-containing protein [Erythrobacter dokdonensis]OBV12265.1 trypsin-like serine protease [Erythrobacter dokdonensis DSW-74]
MLATPVQAMPKDPAELAAIIQNKYGGDANSYVDDNKGEFRKMGCNGRADLLQALLDAGLVLENLEQGRYSAHTQAIRCAFEKGKMEALALVLTPDAMAMFEEVEFGQTWQASLLSQAIYWDSYDRVRYLLENGVHAVQHDKDAAILTREEHLLLAAYQALDTEKEDAIRAFQDAGFGHILDAARNKANYRYVIDRITGSGGGGGGGLFRSLLGGVAGAALGGTTGAALGFLGAGANAADENDTNGAAQGNGPLPLATNRADLGLDLAPVTAPRRGLQVQQVLPDGPGALAGLAKGDVILTIAGLPVASRGSFYVATHKAFGIKEYAVEYMRGGEVITTVVGKAQPQEIATPEERRTPSDANVAASVGTDTATTLDQLKKLGELRESGVLSEEEFEAMKARILEGG